MLFEMAQVVLRAVPTLHGPTIREEEDEDDDEPIGVKLIEENYDSIRVRYRYPWRFEEIEEREGPNQVAARICDDARVKMGKTKAGNWLVQSVVFDRDDMDRQTARRVARKIQQQIDAH